MGKFSYIPKNEMVILPNNKFRWSVDRFTLPSTSRVPKITHYSRYNIHSKEPSSKLLNDFCSTEHANN